jgi:hypothetical protein
MSTDHKGPLPTADEQISSNATKSTHTYDEKQNTITSDGAQLETAEPASRSSPITKQHWNEPRANIGRIALCFLALFKYVHRILAASPSLQASNIAAATRRKPSAKSRDQMYSHSGSNSREPKASQTRLP